MDVLSNSRITYRDVVENADLVVVGMDLSGATTFMNSVAKRLFTGGDGAVSPECLGEIAGAIANRSVCTTEKPRPVFPGVDGGSGMAYEQKVCCRNGEIRWIDWTCFPVRDDKGKLVEILCVGREVTEEKRIARELRLHNRLLKALHGAYLDLVKRTAPVEEILEYTLQTAMEWMDTPHGFVLVLPRERERGVVEWARGVFECLAGKEMHPSSAERCKEVRENGYFLVERWEDVPFRAGSDGDGNLSAVRSLVGIPLQCDSGRRVVVALARMKGEAVFEKIEISVLRQLGNVACLALDKADLVAKSERELVRRKEQEEALLESEERYRIAIECSNDGVTMVRGPIHIYANRRMAEMFGYDSPADIVGKSVELLVHPSDRKRVMDLNCRRQKGELVPSRYTFKGVRLDGGEIDVEVSATRTFFRGERVSLAYLRDITDRTRAQEEKARLESELRHAQKMEALGTLAGGIAHDFNNLLQAVSGYSQLLLSQKDSRHPDCRYLVEIEKAAQRARDLTRQLLAFSRKLESDLKPMDLNREVRQIHQILQRTFPKTIRIELDLADDLKWILGDSLQIGQVIMNLSVNARDAMPSGGTLTIRTENTSGTHMDRSTESASPGEGYVLLTVSDTGLGMDGNTLERVFEPFFTTKEVGRGTGLGLAMAYGIVKNHNGYIYCCSEVGKGTLFQVYFPELREPPAAEKAEDGDVQPKGGKEVVLLVDDEKAILDIARTMLERYGYRIRTAESGEEALAVYESGREKIDLVVLDLGMPGMGGERCLNRLYELDPGVKVIVATGYLGAGELPPLVAEGKVSLLRKPYSLTKLVEMVRQVLDGE